jgi:hypothetical protein
MRSIGCLALVLTFVAFAACNGAPSAEPKQTPKGASTGRVVDEAEMGKLAASAKMTFSTGEDMYRRVLALKVSDLEGECKVGAPILISLDIINYAQELDQDGKKPGHPSAQLFPHLTVWVKDSTSGKEVSSNIKLPFESQFHIKPGEAFTHTIDLSKVETLTKPGLYDVSVGHSNFMVLDMGDWTGMLRSRPQTIRIVAK